MNQASAFSALDKFITNNFSFAIYRAPHDEEPSLILQNDLSCFSHTSLLELPIDAAFIMSHFDMTHNGLLIGIRAENIIYGTQAIGSFISNINCPSPENLEAQPYNDKASKKSRVVGDTTYEQYAQAFNKYNKAIRDGQFEKLVLARKTSMAFKSDFSPALCFEKACKDFPSAFVYLCHTPLSGTWMAASPEMLLSGKDNQWNTVALAGTQKIDLKSPERLWDEKNKREQAIVAKFMRECLQLFGTNNQEKGEYTQQAGNIQHLRTDFSFELKRKDLLLPLLSHLLASPAVGGCPKEEACQFILENEPLERKFYAGIVGVLNPKSKTDLYVNLRCMEIFSNAVQLYAGGGIMEDSVLDKEWQETEDKLQNGKAMIQ